MKRVAALALGLILPALSALQALPTDVVYAEGDAAVRYRSGVRAGAEIGDRLDTGDTVSTGLDGFVEMEQSGVSIKVQPKTVFTLMEKQQAGRKGGVLSLAVGSIRFRYDKLTGTEPIIQTGSCVAGVRGTELSVFAGADGSSLIVVEQGAVAVEAAGGTVELGPGEAVEVRAGEAPGEKFPVLVGKVDYSRWNEEKLAAMRADPLRAARGVQRRLEDYAAELGELMPVYLERKGRLDAEREKNRAIKAEKGAEEAQRYYLDVVSPLELESSNLYLNVRYYALSALSLRRFVLGRMYVQLKALHMAAPQGEEYRQFLDVYESALGLFEGSIVPYLVAADI